MKIRSTYSDPVRVAIEFQRPSRTKQEFKDSSDINQIMAKFIRTGHLEHAAKFEPRYGFATGESYHEALTVVAEAQSMFEELPSATRLRFDNDPAKFLDFVQDEENKAELKKMGLINKTWTADPEPLPDTVQVAKKAPTGAQKAPAPVAPERSEE